MDDLPTLPDLPTGLLGCRLFGNGKSFSLEVLGLVGRTLYPQSVSCMGVNRGVGDCRDLRLPPISQYAFLLMSYPIGSMRWEILSSMEIFMGLR